MNKRLVRLLDISGFNQPELEPKLENLMQLIVNECVDVIMNNSDRYRKEYFAGLLKEHFDIK